MFHSQFIKTNYENCILSPTKLWLKSDQLYPWEIVDLEFCARICRVWMCFHVLKQIYTLKAHNRGNSGCCLLELRKSSDQNNQDRKNYFSHRRELKRTRRNGAATFSSYLIKYTAKPSFHEYCVLIVMLMVGRGLPKIFCVNMIRYHIDHYHDFLIILLFASVKSQNVTVWLHYMYKRILKE